MDGGQEASSSGTSYDGDLEEAERWIEHFRRHDRRPRPEASWLDLYAVLLARWPASRAAYVFVVLPLVTVALSAWLDDEPITPWLLLGGALVLAGVYLGALRRPERVS